MADNKLIVVDPNPKDNELVPLENLTISVELETISKGRSILTTEGKFKNTQRKAKVNFINGSPVDGKNSLTTNYTEVNTKFNTDNKDLENLGITNIDIDFDSSYTPMVKIDFIDIRGNSIFEHGQDSTYNVFFELPYPIFKLTVKGYYGKAVSYCLHLRKWNSRFNSNTGNFEISCEFIGYTYAFLSDMLLGYLKGIVQTKKGKEKLKAKNVMSIAELLQKTAELDLNNDKLKETNNVKENFLIDKLLIKISDIRKTLIYFIDGYNKINDSVRVLYNNTENIPDNILGLYIVTNTDNTVIEEYDSTFNDLFTDQIKEFNSESGAYSLSESLFVMNGGIKTYIGVEFKNGAPKGYIVKTGESTSIENATTNEVANSLISIGNQSSLNNAGFVKVYNINDTITQLNLIESQLKTKKEFLKTEITNEIQKNITETYGNGFSPTIKNIVEILITHVEIFMESLREVGIEAENAHKSDELKKFKSIDTNQKDDTVYPFPKYYNYETAEEKWIGNDYPNIPEVKFINELLEGMITAVKNETELMNQITNSRNWYPVNIFDRTYGNDSINPYIDLDKEGGQPVDFIRLMTLRAVAFLTSGNISYTNNELTAMAKLEANNVYSSMSNESARRNILTLTKETLLKKVTTSEPSYKNNLSTDGIILKKISETSESNYIYVNSAGISSTITVPSKSTSYSYEYLNDGVTIYLPLGGTNFSFKGKEITKHLNFDNNNNIIISSDIKYKINYNGLFNLIKPEDYFNNEPFPSYGDKIISEIKDNPNYNLFKGTFSYTEKLVDNGILNLYNFYHNYDNNIQNQGILTNNKIKSTDGYSGNIKVNDLYKLLEKGKSYTQKNSDIYNIFYYETSEKGNFKNDLIESNTKDIHIEDIVFGNRKNGHFSKSSLFGSEFYYRQESEEAKAFLFLNSIGFLSNVYDENIRKTIYNNFNNAAYVSTPKAWVYYIGSILWRYFSKSEPITFISKVDITTNKGVNIKLTTNDYEQEIDDLLDDGNLYRLLYDNYDFEIGETLYDGNVYPPQKDELFSSEGVVTSNDDLMCFTDGEYAKVDKILTLFPYEMREKFITEFTNWVKTDWLNLKNELEIFNNYNYNNSATWDITWEGFNDNITYINNNFTHKNYYILRRTQRSNDYDEYTSNKNLSRDYMLSFSEDSEIIKNILSFLKEEIIIQNGSPKLWRSISRDFKIDEVSFNKYIDALLNELKELNKTESNNKNNIAEKEELFQITNNDDIKLNLYRNVKAIYDKWIGEDNIAGCIRRDKLIDTFRFLNKSFKNIGDEFLINPLSITNYIEGFSNRSCSDMISKILADNGFDFIALPNFVDFKEQKELKEMFRPHEIGEAPTVGPAFICMYANRANTLDLGNKSDTGDSGFNIKEDGSAFLLDGKPAFNNSEETIAAFLVKYGDDNQSIFKDIRLDQKEFSETDESLIIIDKMANSKEPGAKANIGQNLYNIYSTRSYSCEIESLGNAMIQPMMYFQLTNIPMFRGAYLILKASHNIKPNHMTTTFKGVRIAGIDVPLVTSETVSLGLFNQFSDVDTTGVKLSKKLKTYTREEFVKEYSPYINSITKGSGLLTGTVLAQAILESSGNYNTNGQWKVGGSQLAQEANNFFGVKADKNWKGEVYNIKTREVFGGNDTFIKDNFRKYASVKDSIKDHLDFLVKNSRYKKAGVFDAKTVEEQAAAIKKAGYATDPNYASIVNDIFNSIKGIISNKFEDII